MRSTRRMRTKHSHGGERSLACCSLWGRGVGWNFVIEQQQQLEMARVQVAAQKPRLSFPCEISLRRRTCEWLRFESQPSHTRNVQHQRNNSLCASAPSPKERETNSEYLLESCRILEEFVELRRGLL